MVVVVVVVVVVVEEEGSVVVVAEDGAFTEKIRASCHRDLRTVGWARTPRSPHPTSSSPQLEPQPRRAE